MVELLIMPFLACLILTVMHAYLGLHVIKRNVIFVDLALAQMAALGGVVAAMLGITNALFTYVLALCCALAGAAVITQFRKYERLSPEVGIGIVYVLASAIAVLLVAKTAVESDMLKQMLTGNILVVNMATVFELLALYGSIGLFHYIFRERFWQVTNSYIQKKPALQIWDFAFYATFAMVVTSSVRIAGVLVVFSYLIVPAALATLVTKDFRQRLWISWFFGVMVSLLGLLTSAWFDLPTGPAIVGVFGVLFFLVLFIYREGSRVFRRKQI